MSKPGDKAARAAAKAERAAQKAQRGGGVRAEVLGPRKLRDAAALAVMRETLDEGRTLLGTDRLWTLWEAARNVAPLGLPVIEVGSYRGGSAAMLARALRAAGGTGGVHAVDTFAGHPEGAVGERDGDVHTTGHFDDTSYEAVSAYLAPLGVTVHRGAFADVAPHLPDTAWALAHIDTDLFGPTLDCLRTLTARMPVGGVVVVDDYDAPKCPGVREAVEAFLAERDGFQLWQPLTEQAVLVRVAEARAP